MISTKGRYALRVMIDLAEQQKDKYIPLKSDAEPCGRQNACRTLEMWKKFDAMVHDYFYGITLADLMNDENN